MANFDSPFGELAWPTASPQQGGPTTPLPGIGTPALNTPVTQPESLKISWRGEGFVQATDSARPAQLDTVFDEQGLASLNNSDGGPSSPSFSLDSPFGELLVQKP